jgi:hypothetical protein
MYIDLYLVLDMDFGVVDVESDFGSYVIGQCIFYLYLNV